MKKLIPAVIVLLLSFNLSAQYKKAGFFEKEGRTYELGSQIYMMGKGNGSPIGYKLGFGRDKDGKRLFSSWDLQFLPSHEYSYTTTDQNGALISVTGNSRTTLIYGANYGIHLLKNEAENKHMFQPFVGLGFNVVFLAGIKDESLSPEPYAYATRQTAEHPFSFGLNGGLGCIVNFTPKWSLKAQGGYSHQLKIGEDYGTDEKPFYVFDHHSFVSLGVRFRITQDSVN